MGPACGWCCAPSPSSEIYETLPKTLITFLGRQYIDVRTTSLPCRRITASSHRKPVGVAYDGPVVFDAVITSQSMKRRCPAVGNYGTRTYGISELLRPSGSLLLSSCTAAPHERFRKNFGLIRMRSGAATIYSHPLGPTAFVTYERKPQDFKAEGAQPADELRPRC